MGKKKELVARWDGFLDKIKERFEQLMDEAEQGCAMLLDLNNLDPLPMNTAWSAIDQQILSLDDKIDDTWSDKVEEKMEDADIDDDKIEKQRKKGEDLCDWMQIEKEKREVKIFSDAAKKIEAKAKEILTKDFSCSQCGGVLPVPENIYRSSYVECHYCQNTNTFEPGTEVRMVEAFCADNLAKLASIVEWEAKFRLAEKVRSKRKAKYELLKEYEAAYRNYYQKYYEARAAVVPQFEKDIEKDVESRMSSFYQDMSSEKNWEGKKVKSAFAPNTGSTKTNGEEVYDAFISEMKSSGKTHYEMVGGPYHTNSFIVTEDKFDWFNEKIEAFSEIGHLYDFCSCIGDGGIMMLNFSQTEKKKKYKVKGFDDSDDRGDFKKMFPGYMPFAFNEDPFGEVFLINKKDAAYPVIFVCGSCVVYVSDDLESFLAKVK